MRVGGIVGGKGRVEGHGFLNIIMKELYHRYLGMRLFVFSFLCVYLIQKKERKNPRGGGTEGRKGRVLFR